MAIDDTKERVVRLCIYLSDTPGVRWRASVYSSGEKYSNPPSLNQVNPGLSLYSDNSLACAVLNPALCRTACILTQRESMAAIDIHNAQATGEPSPAGLSQESIPLGHVIADKSDAG